MKVKMALEKKVGFNSLKRQETESQSYENGSSFDISVYLSLNENKSQNIMENQNIETTKSEEKSEINVKRVEKSKRWDVNHNALYDIYSLGKTSGDKKIDISFKNSRRSYQRYDKQFAQLLISEFYPHLLENQTLKKQSIEKYAKRTKSKFNTLKRSYFKSKKHQIQDFPFYIYTESKKIVDHCSDDLASRLRHALTQWKEYHLINQTPIGLKLQHQENILGEQESKNDIQ